MLKRLALRNTTEQRCDALNAHHRSGVSLKSTRYYNGKNGHDGCLLQHQLSVLVRLIVLIMPLFRLIRDSHLLSRRYELVLALHASLVALIFSLFSNDYSIKLQLLANCLYMSEGSLAAKMWHCRAMPLAYLWLALAGQAGFGLPRGADCC